MPFFELAAFALLLLGTAALFVRFAEGTIFVGFGSGRSCFTVTVMEESSFPVTFLVGSLEPAPSFSAIAMAALVKSLDSGMGMLSCRKISNISTPPVSLSRVASNSEQCKPTLSVSKKIKGDR